MVCRLTSLTALVASLICLPGAIANDPPKSAAVYRVALGTRSDPAWTICGKKVARIWWDQGTWQRDETVGSLAAWLCVDNHPTENHMFRVLGAEDMDRDIMDECCHRRAACIGGFIQVIPEDGVPVPGVAWDSTSWEGWYHQYYANGQPQNVPPRVATVIMEPRPQQEVEP